MMQALLDFLLLNPHTGEVANTHMMARDTRDVPRALKCSSECLCYKYCGICCSTQSKLYCHPLCRRFNNILLLHQDPVFGGISLGIVSTLDISSCDADFYSRSCTTLNGTHGEYTNEDDVRNNNGDKKLVNDNNKRNHKEATNAQNYGSQETSHRNPDNAARRVAENEKKKEKEKEVIEKAASIDAALGEPEVVKAAMKYVVGFSFNGVSCFVRSNGSNGFQVAVSPMEDEIVAWPGTVGAWLVSKDGYHYSNDEKSLHQIPLPAHVIICKLPAFSYKHWSTETRNIDRSDHYVLLPLLKLLQRHWQQPDYKESTESAIRNYALKAFSEACNLLGHDAYMEMEVLFRSTVEYFILTWIAKKQSIDLLGNRDPMMNPHHVFKTAWYGNYSIEQTDTFLKVNCTARHLPRVKVNGIEGYKFETKSGITLVVGSGENKRRIELGRCQMLQDVVGFTYNEKYSIAGAELSKNYVSVGMDLIPCCWDRSDVYDTRSYLDAIQKRLLGARDNESELWQKQQAWLIDVAEVHGDLPSNVKTLLGVKMDPYFERHLTDNRDLRRQTDSFYISELPYCRGHASLLGHGFVERISGEPPKEMPVMDAIDQLLYDTSRWIPGRVADFANTAATNFVDGAWSIYAKLYSDYINRETYANLEGPKRQQRLRVLEGVRYAPKTGLCQPTAYLKDEIDKANPEKPSRIFVSYGDTSSFLDPALIGIVKKRLQGRITRTYEVGGRSTTVDCYTFTCPKTTEIEALFKHMISIDQTPDTIVFGCFSDDSVIAWNLPCGIGYANVDISSCDSSNGPLIFSLVYRMLHQLDPESAFFYLQQCRQPILCRNPQDNEQLFKILFPTCFEGSGTALTTILNTVASVLICFAIVHVLIREPSLAIEKAIVKGAELVGHKVTVDLCVDGSGGYVPEKIQFLKFSPMRTTAGNYVPVRNLGCIIRGLGKTFGDMTPRQLGMTDAEWRTTSQQVKFHKFIGGVIQGLKHEAHHPFLDGLRENFTPIQLQEAPTLVEADGIYSHFTLDEGSLLNRYPIDRESLNQLYLIARELRLGSIVSSPAFIETMVVDYGLTRRSATPLMGEFTSMGVDLTTSV